MGTGAITEEFAYAVHEPARTMSRDEAAAVLLAGAAAGAYRLPPALTKAAAGAAALEAEQTRLALALAAGFMAGWEGDRVARLTAALLRDAVTSGTLPALDIGQIGTLRAEEARLRDELRVFENAAGKALEYPGNIAAGAGEAIAAMLGEALAELLTVARPHAGKIAKLASGASELAAHRTDGPGYDALEKLTDRLAAIEAAAQSLAALGKPWAGAPAHDGGSPVLRLARLATGTL
jgi:hypothetical protein